MIAFDVMRISG